MEGRVVLWGEGFIFHFPYFFRTAFKPFHATFFLYNPENIMFSGDIERDQSDESG